MWIYLGNINVPLESRKPHNPPGIPHLLICGIFRFWKLESMEPFTEVIGMFEQNPVWGAGCWRDDGEVGIDGGR